MTFGNSPTKHSTILTTVKIVLCKIFHLKLLVVMVSSWPLVLAVTAMG